MSARAKVNVQVKAVPVPRSLVRAQVAGELIHACGGSDTDVEVGQRGVLRQLIEKVIVYGIDAAGNARDKIEVSFDDNASGDVLLDLDGGTRSAIEALDAGLGRAVAYAARRMRARGLSADVRYVLTERVRASEELLTAARAELGLSPVDAPSWRQGYQPREVLRLRPGKDSGILSSFYSEFGE